MKEKLRQKLTGVDGRFIDCYYVKVEKSVTIKTIFDSETTEVRYQIPNSRIDEFNRLVNEIKKLSVNG